MRPFFPLLEQAKEYVLDEIHSIRAFRLTALLELKGRTRTPEPIEFMIDTGAPFSVLPYGVWAHENVEFVLPPGRSLRYVVRGAPGPEAAGEMTWLGVPCTMGQARASLVDEQGRRSLPLTMLAKLPTRPVHASFEKLVILGQHFFAFNRLTLLTQPGRAFPVGWSDGRRRNVIGWIAAPPPDGLSVALERPESLAPRTAPQGPGS